MRPFRLLSVLGPACLVGLASPPAAHARVRQFSYSRESGAATPGAAEFQFSTTDRAGREQRFNQLDNRLEVEVGLTERLMTAFYLNTASSVAGEGADRRSSSGVTGVTTEWKYTFHDAKVDPVGAALFLDATGGPEVVDTRLKVILDGVGARSLWVLNLTFNENIEDVGGLNIQTRTGEINGGVSFAPVPEFSLGGELWSFGSRRESEFEGLTIYVGPTATWNPGPVWISTTLLAQAGTLGGPEGTFTRDLVRRESVNFRLLFGRAL